MILYVSENHSFSYVIIKFYLSTISYTTHVIYRNYTCISSDTWMREKQKKPNNDNTCNFRLRAQTRSHVIYRNYTCISSDTWMREKQKKTNNDNTCNFRLRAQTRSHVIYRYYTCISSDTWMREKQKKPTTTTHVIFDLRLTFFVNERILYKKYE